MRTATIHVLQVGDRDDPELKDWVATALEDHDVNVDVVDLGIVGYGFGSAAGAALTGVPPADLWIVDASGSLGAGRGAASLNAVKAIRQAVPDVSILAALFPERMETLAERPGATSGDLLGALTSAQKRVLDAGATDYVVAPSDTRSPDSRAVLRHRLDHLLKLRSKRLRKHKHPPRHRPAGEEQLGAAAPGVTRSAAPTVARDGTVKTAGGRPELRREEPPRGDPSQEGSFREDPFRTPWEALYDSNGRYNAKKIAAELGTKLKPLAAALDLTYTAVHREPSAPAYQAALRPVARVLEMLHDSFPRDAAVRKAWLNRVRADLEDASPLEVILAGEVDAVVSLLEGAQLGIGL